MASLAAALVFGLPAQATQATKIQSNRDWTVYTFTEHGNKVCYIASQPVKDEGKYTKRGDIFTFITHRPAADERGVISVLSGYTYKKGSAVNLDIDDTSYILFTQGDRTWAPDAQTDASLVSAMRKGKKMVVKGTSSRGTQTTDTYSLMGFTKSLEMIDKECGIK